MVRPITGWTANGEEYRIIGGYNYIKENNCYQIIFYRKDKIEELWDVPATNLTIEDLQHRLQGPLEIYDTGPPYGRAFLCKISQKPKFQRRLR